MTHNRKSRPVVSAPYKNVPGLGPGLHQAQFKVIHITFDLSSHRQRATARGHQSTKVEAKKNLLRFVQFTAAFAHKGDVGGFGLPSET
jgi:hypothetical protein